MDGWIKIYRQIQLSGVWRSDEPFDRRSAWIYLIINANYKDQKTFVDGKLIVIKKGQLLTSIRSLGDEWKWSRGKVCRFLDILENDGMIKRETDTKKTLLTIVNYSIFQSQRDKNGTVTGQSRDSDGTLTDTNKNIKNYKNYKNGENNARAREPSTKKKIQPYRESEETQRKNEEFYEWFQTETINRNRRSS